MTQTTDPTFTIWNLHGSGISPMRGENAAREIVRVIARDGGCIVRDNRYSRPCNHHIIGCGAGHDDADFAETGRSHAAWAENGDEGGDPFGGRRIEAVRQMEREAARSAQ